MRTLTCMAVALIFTSGAVAATGYNATLAQPLTGAKELVVNDNLFRCNGSTCVLVSHPTRGAGDLSTCRALQHKVGVLTSYVADGTPFDADKLAKCNSAG